MVLRQHLAGNKYRGSF